MLKVGQKVRICSKEQLQRTERCFGLDSDMYDYCDKITTITRIAENWTSRAVPDFNKCAYFLKIDNEAWIWSNLQLIPVEPMVNIF